MSGERPKSVPCRAGEWVRDRTGAEDRHFRYAAGVVFLSGMAVLAIFETTAGNAPTTAGYAGTAGMFAAFVLYAVGKESEELPRCPGCRTPVQPEPANYCRRCGAKLYAEEWPERPPAEQAEVTHGGR